MNGVQKETPEITLAGSLPWGAPHYTIDDEPTSTQMEMSLVQILGDKKHELEARVLELEQENEHLRQIVAGLRSILDGGVF